MQTPSISADGRVVVFITFEKLVDPDVDGDYDVYA